MDERVPPGGADRAPRASFNPARALVLGFLIAIALGTILLSLPQAVQPGGAVGFVDALFTATSAVCVTGLVVVDTGSTWSPFGQVVIALLIQFGGLGIMTGSVLVAVLLGKRITFRERLALSQTLGQPGTAGVVRLVREVALMVFTLELVGMLLLFLLWVFDYPVPQAAFLAFFHSISAFNNAGFDLFGSSLSVYAQDTAVNLVVVGLVTLGGLGFLVLTDLYRWAGRVNNGQSHRFSLHTRLTLTVSGVLLLITYLTVLIIEFHNPKTLGALDWHGKLLAPLFHAAASRTSGFVTVDIGAFAPATLLVTIFMMFIGGAPASTAGGIKTTTLGVLAADLWATLTGTRDVTAFRRRLTRDVADRALAIALLFMLVLGSVAFSLMLTEGTPFLATLFEAISALGTVGMSMGLTPDLSVPGRLIVVMTMFVGRLGPLTLAYAVARRQAGKTEVRYPEEKVLVG